LIPFVETRLVINYLFSLSAYIYNYIFAIMHL
jgi:hypothetical protein